MGLTAEIQTTQLLGRPKFKPTLNPRCDVVRDYSGYWPLLFVLLQSNAEIVRKKAERARMEHFGGGMNWSMVPNIQPLSNPNTPSNQDHLFLQQQQQFQQQFTQQQQQPQPRFQQQQPQQNQSLASHFNIFHVCPLSLNERLI